MLTVLPNRIRSFRFQGDTRLVRVRLSFTRYPRQQRTLPSDGITDVVDGTLILPISAKYPQLARLRWVDYTGRVQGSESIVEFETSDFYPTSELCSGFELYLKQGSEVDVDVLNGGGSVSFEDYYTKEEVLLLLGAKADLVDTYDKDAIDAFLATHNTYSDTYTKAQVNALIPTNFRGFTYDQTATPATPQNGETWRERDMSGNILMDWFYKTSVTKWQSLQLHTLHLGYSSQGASTTFEFTGNANNTSYGIRLVELSNLFYVFTTNNGSNYWQCQLQQFGSGTNVGSAFNTSAISPNTATVSTQTLTNTYAVGASQAFALQLTKSPGTPGNISGKHSLRYRYER